MTESRANLITSDRQATRAETENAQGLGDPRAEAQGSHGRFPQDRQAPEEALDGSTNGFREQFVEHAPARVPAVVAPHVLVDVALEPLLRDGVVDAADAIFEQTEEPLNGLRVNVPVNVDPRRVVDAPMVVALPDLSVRGVVVGKEDRLRNDELPRLHVKRSPSTIGNNLCAQASLALNRSEDDGFFVPRLHPSTGQIGTRELVTSPTIRLARLPADECLVGFDFARQLHVVLQHQLVPNPVEHAPRGLVVNAKLALQLLGGDSATCACHEIHRVEPQLERRGRAFEDRSLHRVDAEAARPAEPARALLRRLVTLEHPLRVTARAVGMLAVRGEALTPQPYK